MSHKWGLDHFLCVLVRCRRYNHVVFIASMSRGLLGVAVVAGTLPSEAHRDLDGLDWWVKRWLFVCYYSCMIIREVVMLPR